MANNRQGVRVARVEDLDRRLTILNEELCNEISAEREYTAELHNLNELVEAKERQIINKREYIQSLERRTVLGYALKVVEELPNSSMVEKLSRFQELLGLAGLTAESVHPVQLNCVLMVSPNDAYVLATQYY